jgi:hypothetical protein
VAVSGACTHRRSYHVPSLVQAQHQPRSSKLVNLEHGHDAAIILLLFCCLSFFFCLFSSTLSSGQVVEKPTVL